MEIILTAGAHPEAVRKYDSHIPRSRLINCIHNRQVYLLRDGDSLAGTLRYSLFWQTLPFPDLIYLDETAKYFYEKPAYAYQ